VDVLKKECSALRGSLVSLINSWSSSSAAASASAVPASSETATPLLDAVNTITAAAAANGPAITSSQREAVALLAKLVKSLQSLLEARVLVSGVQHPTPHYL